MTVEKALETYGAPVYVRKEIVHNRHVVSTLARARRDLRRARPTRCPRAHSSCSPRTASRPRCTQRPRERNLRTIDATCPLVTKVHQEAKRFAARGLRHPADRPRGPRGGRGHRRRGPRAHPAGGRPRGRRHGRGPRPGQGRLALADHAVGRRDDGDGVDALRERFPDAVGPAQRRHLLRHAEPPGRGQGDRAAVRPGHRRRLDELLELGAAGRGRRWRPAPAPPTWSTTPAEIDEAWLDGVGTVGVTSGASVPDVLVEDVLDWLAERGYATCRKSPPPTRSSPSRCLASFARTSAAPPVPEPRRYQQPPRTSVRGGCSGLWVRQ